MTKPMPSSRAVPRLTPTMKHLKPTLLPLLLLISSLSTGCAQVSEQADSDRRQAFVRPVQKYADAHPSEADELRGFMDIWEQTGVADAATDQKRYDRIEPVVEWWVGQNPEQKTTYANLLTVWRDSIRKRSAILFGGG